jgi:hypothetical protein
VKTLCKALGIASSILFASACDDAGVAAASSPTTIRLIANGNGTLSDPKTGLMWADAVSTQPMTFAEAAAYCDNLTLAGRDDWRLPTLQELLELYSARRGGEDRPFDARHPIVDWRGSEVVWSSTPYRSYTSAVEVVFFRTGLAFVQKKSEPIPVLPVRDASAPTPTPAP